MGGEGLDWLVVERKWKEWVRGGELPPEIGLIANYRANYRANKSLITNYRAN